MKSIHYAGEILMTGDAIADAVVKYAETLAKYDTSASIDVPVITDAGLAVNASFLLGPASQIVAVPVETDVPDPQDQRLVDTMRQRRRELTGVPVQASDDDLHQSYDEDF